MMKKKKKNKKEQEKAPTITVDIPAWFSIRVNDYHEFPNIQDSLKNSLGLKVEYEEVGCDGWYEAIFWIGKKPVKIINEAKATYEDEE